MPKLDAIFAVDDLKQFHADNYAMNKKHYTMMNRMTRNKMVLYFQNKGGKVHFNNMKVIDPELSEETGNQEKTVRFSVLIRVCRS